MGIAWWIVLLGAASVCIAYVVKYGRSLLRIFYLSSKIPGPSPWKLGREYVKALYMGEDVLTIFNRLTVYYEHKPWGVWTHRGYLLFVSDHASVSEVYKNKHLSDRSGLITDLLQRYAGKGLLSLNGPEHKLHRKITGPAFRRPVLESMLPSFNQAAVKLVKMLKANGSGEEVDVRFLVTKQVFELLISSSSSGSVSAQRLAELQEALAVISGIAAEIQLETVNPVYHWLFYKRTKVSRKLHTELAAFTAVYDVACREVYDYVVREIDDTVDTTSGTLLEALFREGLRSKVDDPFALVAAESKQILFAGLETIAIVLNISLLLLALHPDVQQKVFQEIDSIFGSDDRPVQPEDLSKMVYLGRFINEALRQFSPVPIIDRVATEETVISGVRVPKGTKVIFHFTGLHWNPSVFKDPWKFDPDRFTSESLQKRHPYAFVPFGSGVKTCPGQVLAKLTAKTFLIHVVRNFKVLPGKKLKCVDDIKTEMQFALHLCASSLCFVDRHGQNTLLEDSNTAFKIH